ncbi:MAG: hypothetical protein ACRC20_08280 [Segniliparus sp.]|uniref:hypothetical protein n=1 Tax=Segniliparus sp. TaxID=2804064 RepID=UPI003F2F2283
MRLRRSARRTARQFGRIVGAGSLACVAATGCTIQLPVGSTGGHDLASPYSDLVAKPDPFLDPAAVNASVSGKTKLEDRLSVATFAAAARGASLSIAYRDRSKDPAVTVSNGEAALKIQAPIASLTKVWIADHLLYEDSLWASRPKADPADPGRVELSADDKNDIESILKNSDDTAAWRLWAKYGRSSVVEEIKDRYRLDDSTVPAEDGTWWNTLSTPDDIVSYYDQLLAQQAAAPPADGSDDDKNAAAAWKNAASQVVQNLEHYNATQTGSCYETDVKEKRQCAAAQTFGFPQALPAEHPENANLFGMKQARMCCVEDHWVYWSTAFDLTAGKNAVLVALSIEKIDPAGSSVNEQRYAATQVTNDESAKHAAVTLTGALMRAFPDGKLP